MNYQILIERGVGPWNRWRHEHPSHQPVLRGIDLRQSYLFEINLKAVDLSGAILSRACLIGADLRGANLAGADLTGAYMSAANLRDANLTGAQVSDVDFKGANLTGTCLEKKMRALAQTPGFLAPTVAFSEPVAQATARQANAVLGTPLASSHAASNARQELQTQLLQPTKLFEPVEPQQVELPAAEPIGTGANFQRSRPASWDPGLLDRCHQKLCEYYISPMVTMLMEDIVHKAPAQDTEALVALVISHIPDEEDARHFRRGLRLGSSRSEQNQLPQHVTPHTACRSTISTSSTYVSSQPPTAPLSTNITLPPVFINNCLMHLSEYYIAPLAEMIVNESIALHQPTTPQQLVSIISQQLTPAQSRQFSQQVLS